MPKFFVLFILIFSFITHASAEVSDSGVPHRTAVQFLKLEGAVAGLGNDALMQEVINALVVPLRTNPNIALYSYVIDVHGDGQFFFHFAAEPLRVTSIDLFNQYIAAAEAQTFHGLKIHFQNVVQISEVTNVRAGNYIANQEDPFDVNFEVSQTQFFATLSEWQNFTDIYGEALLSTNHATFKKYLATLIKDPKDFAAVSQALAISNMMAIDPRIYLTLEDGSIVDGEMTNSPFIPFQFFRNCYESRYENGFCF